MAVKFTNNAATTLAAGINSSATSISVTDGSVFPSLSSGEHFYCTFDDTTNTEIVKVTARSSNTLTVVRGQDNTTARAFSSGDKAELRVVAALLEDVKTEVTSTLNVDTFTSDGTSAAFTLSQAPSSEDNLIVFIEGVYQNPGDFTLSGTTLTLDAVPPNTRKVVAYHVSGAVAGNNLNHDQFTANGSTAAFTLSISPIHENNTQVFIDGVYQQKDSYSVSGTTLTLDANPSNGAKVEVMTFTQTDVNTIPASFVAGLTEVSAVGADHLLVYDATDNALKKALASDLIETVGATPTFTTANITNTTTGDSLLFTTTEDSSTAAPVITLKRNSSSPADADYLGQLKFKGENDADQEVIYAKITSKIQDASDGSEDGLLEFANIKAGSQTITARLKSDKLQLLNSTGLEVAGLTYPTSDGSNGQALVTDGSGNLSFSTVSGGVAGISSSADATAITIDSSENVTFAQKVGIGVTPTHNFNLSSAGAVEARFTSTDNDCYLQIASDTDEGQDSVLQFLSGTSARGSITYDHNTTAASQNMIFKTGDNAVSAMTLTGDGKMIMNAPVPSIQLTDTDNNADAYIQGTDGNLRFFADDSQEASSSMITFAVDGTQRMRMAADGQLGINQNSAENHARLVVRPNVTSETCFQFNTNADARRWFYIVDGYYGYQGAEQIYANGGINRYFTNAAATAVGSIVVNSGSTAFNTTSDYRLKDNPQPLTGSGEFIDGLQPKTWTWNHGDGGTGVGFIAHEAADVGLGLCVTGEKDAVSVDKVLNEETGEYEEQTTPTYQQLDYSSGELIANMVAELQSLRARIETLENA